ncbi:MAG: hypothetical protein ACLFQV_03840 [Vulcanimicrobiota bacterium]
MNLFIIDKNKEDREKISDVLSRIYGALEYKEFDTPIVFYDYIRNNNERNLDIIITDLALQEPFDGMDLYFRLKTLNRSFRFILTYFNSKLLEERAQNLGTDGCFIDKGSLFCGDIDMIRNNLIPAGS